MLFTCKKFMFSDFTWKKKFAPGNGEKGVAPPACPLSLRPCIMKIL